MPVPLYFAPLEGITDATFRRVHHAHFDRIDKYFIPFISPTQTRTLTKRERAVLALNRDLFAVPQILTRDPALLLWAANELRDMGYNEINLNLGCPSGTVTAKGKGAGMLRDLEALERFLDEACARLSTLGMKLSIKTRIGYDREDEFEPLLSLFSRYPLCELIVHLRTRNEFYEGVPHRDIFLAAVKETTLPLVYNGNLFTAQDCHELLCKCPDMHAMMLGRGIVANPALAREVLGGTRLTHAELRAFHDALLAAWLAWHPQNVVTARMRELMKWMSGCFEDVEKPLKRVCKAKRLEEYQIASAQLFDACPLKAEPAFQWTS